MAEAAEAAEAEAAAEVRAVGCSDKEGDGAQNARSYFADASRSYPLLLKVAAGGFAGMISRTATAPIDRVKMLMQARPAGEPLSIRGGIAQIRAEGGGAAFFRGNGVNVIKIAPETAVKLVTFERAKQLLAADPYNVTVWERFAAGGLAGAVAQAVIYPLEIGKTRLAVSPPGTYRGLLHCLGNIIKYEGPVAATALAAGSEVVLDKTGVRALYRGFGASVFGIIPYAGVDLAVNSLLKEAAARHFEAEGREPGIAALLGCGMASSTCAMLATYPLNLVRTRLQMSGMRGTVSYDSAFHCFRETVRAAGFRGLYRGLVPNMLKVLPATSISYTIFDLLNGTINRHADQQ